MEILRKCQWIQWKTCKQKLPQVQTAQKQHSFQEFLMLWKCLHPCFQNSSRKLLPRDPAGLSSDRHFPIQLPAWFLQQALLNMNLVPRISHVLSSFLSKWNKEGLNICHSSWAHTKISPLCFKGYSLSPGSWQVCHGLEESHRGKYNSRSEHGPCVWTHNACPQQNGLVWTTDCHVSQDLHPKSFCQTWTIIRVGRASERRKLERVSWELAK